MDGEEPELVKIFGFALLTLIFLFFFLYNMGLRNKTSLVILPLIITVVTIFTFTHVMSIILPRGSGIFRNISILFLRKISIDFAYYQQTGKTDNTWL